MPALTRPWVLFSVSGNAKVGLGHVMRSRALAEELPEGLEARFHAREEESRKILGPKAGRSLEALLRKGPAALVFDRPRAQSFELAPVRRRHPHLPILALDYFGRDADAAANLHDHAHPRAAVHVQGTQLAIVRPAFRKLARPSPPKSVKRVLLAFGGADPNGHTMKALAFLDRRAPLKVDILTGPLFKWQAELDAAVQRSRNHCIHHGTIDEPAALMAKADLAFSGGGTTSLELCCLGVPTVVMPQTREEKAFASARKGAIELFSTKRTPRLFNDAAALAKLHHGGKASVDGLGAQRLAGMIAALAGVSR